MNLMLIILMVICLVLTSTACQPRGKGTIQKQLGSTFHFRCPIRTSCKGKDYIYTHYNQVTGTPAVVFEGKRFARKISSLDYGGDYCCTDQCSSSQSGPKCCITVAISPVVQWDLPKAVALHGSPVTGSLSVTGYPRPSVRAIIPSGCDYQQKVVHIGRHTSKAVFTINTVTKNCEQLYGLIWSKTYSVLRTNQLLIIENVTCSGTRQTRSTPTTTTTQISTEESGKE